jgi:hypothetical protein
MTHWLSARGLLLSLLILAVGPSGGCSDANLQPRDPDVAPAADNLLSVSGSLCTDEPERSNYPVKILFVIDTSGSMQFTDPNKRIKVAVEDVVNRFRSNPAVKFAIITFNGIVRVNSAEQHMGGNTYDHVTSQSLGRSAAFYPGNSLPAGALDAIVIRDAVTDYQGALGATFRLLELDMLAAPPSERTRTKYVVMFLSDGWPNPRCTTDCMNTQAQPVCLDRSTLPPFAKDAFPELKTCQDYNQNYQILAKVDQIMRLRDIYSVGDLRMHTAWLRDPNDAVSGTFGYKPEDAKKLLAEMAQHGNGTTADYYKGEDVTFANVDYSAILRPFALSQVLALNTSGRPGLTGYAPDTDGDGLPDAEEERLGTDARLADTDSDGFRDGFEQLRLSRGFDPRTPGRPWFTCSEREDLDGDGLIGCEELVLGTDARLQDTDGDRMPDGVEALAGTDPLVPDDAIDSDADGIFNLQEIQAQTNPQVADGTLYRDHRISYAIKDRGENAGQQRCYDFEVSHIELTPTLGPPNQPSGRGVNRVLLYFGQAPIDAGARDPGRWRVACVDAVYVPPMFKLPATGRLQLGPGDIREAQKFNARAHCVQAK